MPHRNASTKHLAAIVLTAASAAAFASAVTAFAGGAEEPRLIPSLADRGPNERRETLPITREKDGQKFVVLSERLSAGGGLARGDVIRATAELQLTTTCVVADSRCIGSQYQYSPKMRAQVVLATSPSATGGTGADPISPVEQKTCKQQRPNRNHHCVLVFRSAEKLVRSLNNLPCAPDECFLNVVASAYHPNAGSGDVVIVGADRPDGSIDGDKARVDGFVARNDPPAPAVKVGGAKIASNIPIKPDGGAGRRVARSLRINGLRRGDVLRIGAEQTFRISRVPYNVYIGSRVIIATSPSETRTRGFVAKAISNGGEISEQNGYNCTQGQSVYEDPCTSEKAATAYVREHLPERNGEPKPVYVNFVTAGAPKLTSAGAGDRISVEGGRIRVARFRASR